MKENGSLRNLADQLFAEAGISFLSPECREVFGDMNRKLFVACSGGADSVFLLYWAFKYVEAIGRVNDLEVLHFNHCLRGKESDGDALFVKSICEGLGLALHCSSWERSVETKSVNEAEARAARFEFFDKICGNYESSCVLVGHHSNDVLESMLMRLSRGSGSVGLSAPRPISYPGLSFKVCRPLLNLSSDTIRETLKKVGVPWREDASNVSDDFYRNRIRNKVIPVWQHSCDRDISAGALEARERLEEDSKALDCWLDQLWPKLIKKENTLFLAEFSELELALQRRALDRLITESGMKMSLQPRNWKQFKAAIQSGGRCVINLSEECNLELNEASQEITLNRLELRPTWNAFRLPIGGAAYLPGGSKVIASWVELNAGLLAKIRGGEFPHTETVFLKVKQLRSLTVRRWLNGDRFRPHGLESEKKVSKLFIDRKVPLDVRACLPFFIADEGEVLWAPHLPPNAAYVVDHKTTHALQLIYKASVVT
ncbi:tRNA lysidine(34) synthetase TilS [Puniceicoccaceae bacterium K14]|nr:tRNA lysidine(34) synthetase TilS [Puniceicoccaceae bacterium K14]